MHKIFIYVCFYHDVQVMEPEYKKLKKVSMCEKVLDGYSSVQYTMQSLKA